MDQSTYTNLTGKTVDNEARFNVQVKLAKQRLERMLGWPLVSSKWDDQYLEIGKSRSECACSNVDPSELDDADTVQGSTRLYRWNPADRYIAVAPLTNVYAVKLVDAGPEPGETAGITYLTLDTDDYKVQWINGNPTYARYIKLVDNDCWIGCNNLRGCCSQRYQLAIDADWGFGCIPLDLQAIWAEMVSYQLDCKRDIKSESITSHSYNKFDNRDPLTLYSADIRAFAGPNGTLNRMPSVA